METTHFSISSVFCILVSFMMLLPLWSSSPFLLTSCFFYYLAYIILSFHFQDHFWIQSQTHGCLSVTNKKDLQGLILLSLLLVSLSAIVRFPEFLPSLSNFIHPKRFLLPRQFPLWLLGQIICQIPYLWIRSSTYFRNQEESSQYNWESEKSQEDLQVWLLISIPASFTSIWANLLSEDILEHQQFELFAVSL